MKFLKYFSFIFLAVLFSSCGSKNLVTASGVANENASAANVIRQHYKEEVSFNTLQAKLRLQYEDETTAQNLNVSLRIKKDETIWLSGSILGITMAKILITPNRVQYYEKLGGTFFDGDFELLSSWLGIPLDFKKVQNLLLGQALYDLRDGKYSSEASEKGYELSPTNQNKAPLKSIFIISPSTLKIVGTQISQPKQNRFATISYPQYEEIGNQFFPNEITILASDPNGSTKIEIEYNKLDINPSISFPFSIPSGYDEISLE